MPLSGVEKNLELHINSTLDWQAHTHTHTRQAESNYMSPGLISFKEFMQSLIVPLNDYGDVFYFDLNVDLLNKIDQLLNNCIEFVFNLRKHDNVFTLLSQLQWLLIR